MQPAGLTAGRTAEKRVHRTNAAGARESSAGISASFPWPLWQIVTLQRIKTTQLVIVPFCRPEVQNGPHWVGSGVGRAGLLCRFWGMCLSPRTRVPWLRSFVHLQSQRLEASSSLFLCFRGHVFASDAYKDACDYTGPTQVIEGDLTSNPSLPAPPLSVFCRVWRCFPTS